MTSDCKAQPTWGQRWREGWWKAALSPDPVFAMETELGLVENIEQTLGDGDRTLARVGNWSGLSPDPLPLRTQTPCYFFFPPWLSD